MVGNALAHGYHIRKNGTGLRAAFSFLKALDMVLFDLHFIAVYLVFDLDHPLGALELSFFERFAQEAERFGDLIRHELYLDGTLFGYLDFLIQTDRRDIRDILA